MPSVSSVTRAVTGPFGFGNDGSNGLLIDTMQLVEPKRSKTVPNHLLETKIYSKVAQNDMVLAKPSVVHFGGFEADKKHVQKLSIVNASTDVIRMHIIPPQTKYFYIKYTKNERLVPGLTIECTIEFTPDEWRYYYDCIRINCPGEQNLVIPIHAYPIMSTKEFPTQFTFPNVPVGHRMTEVFPLRCDAPVDFEFNLAYTQPHPAFTVNPMNGIIPAQGEADIAVTFAPFEFQTALMKIQLTISQFNSKPIVCQFTGSSVPGLLKDMSMQEYDNEMGEEMVLDPRCLTPLERSRSKKKIGKSTWEETFNKPQDIEYGGVRFPPNLETPYAVAQVLNQEPGKLRAKDLRETVLAKSKPDKSKKATRQMKEALFEHNVRQNVYEERQNQLRWQVKLGDDQITNDARATVLTARGEAWDEYMYKRRGDPVVEDEYIRTQTQCTLRRTFRNASQLAPEEAMFDTYTNDLWAVRHKALSKFAQAARKVIIRTRATEKLKSLAKLVTEWKEKRFTSAVTRDQQDKLDEDAKRQLIPSNMGLCYDAVHKYTFPTYVPPNVKDDMAPDALGKVPFKATEVVVKTKVPFHGLKVPQIYRLMGYQPHESHSSASGYVAPKLARPLRSGAEDEVITLSAYQADTTAPRVVDVTEEGAVTLPEGVEEPPKPEVIIQPQAVALTPPKALFHPIDYPALHIFNPAPGLQVFQTPIPFAEVDPDFHLCPLPRYFKKDHATNPHAATQRKYLDREDVVRGVMTWKKFPSQGLTSLSNTPTLTNVWVPRWDDQFDGDLLPRDVPDLLDSLPDDDRQNIVDDDEEEGRTTSRQEVSLTPEMVKAQFSMIDMSAPTDEKTSQEMFPYGNKLPTTNIPVASYGPVPREKREEEIEYFMMKKYNKLGGKIQSKTTQLNTLLTDPKLVLK